jgi:hypothetical protein
VVERDSLQPGESLAAVGVAKPDRQLVVDEPAAAIGEDGWPTGQARPVLLAAAGGESSDAAAICGDDAKDRRLADGDGVDAGDGRTEIRRRGGEGRQGVERNALEGQGLPVLVSCGGAKMALGGAENGSRRKKCTAEDTEDGGWGVY